MSCICAAASARKHHDKHNEMPIAEDQDLLWVQTEASTTPISLPSLTKKSNVTCKVRSAQAVDTDEQMRSVRNC